MDNIDPNISVQETPKGLRIEFHVQLDIDTISKLWQSCLDLQKKYQPSALIIDLKNVVHCDSTGIALLQELKHRQINAKKHYTLENASHHLQDLLKLSDEKYKEPHHFQPSQHNSFREKIGYLTMRLLNDLRDNITFLGHLSYHLLQTIRHPSAIRWKDMWAVAEDTGPHALSLVALIGFLIGFITAFQSALPLERFGAQLYIANLVGLGLMREMGPLMTAVLLASRTASAFSAEISSMKINQEIDALTTMGLDSVKFLVVPRIIAVAIMTPLLNIFLIFFGLIGCGIVMQTLGYHFDIYMHQLKQAIVFKDFLGGLFKAFVFGILIAAIGCFHGLKAKIGAKAVGESTTSAVVSSIIMIVIVDGLFACIYYALGI